MRRFADADDARSGAVAADREAGTEDQPADDDADDVRRLDVEVHRHARGSARRRTTVPTAIVVAMNLMIERFSSRRLARIIARARRADALDERTHRDADE